MIDAKTLLTECKRLGVAKSGTKKSLLVLLKAKNATGNLVQFREAVNGKYTRISSKADLLFNKILILFYSPSVCVDFYVKACDYYWAFAESSYNFRRQESFAFGCANDVDAAVRQVFLLREFKTILNSPKKDLKFSKEEIIAKVNSLYELYRSDRVATIIRATIASALVDLLSEHKGSRAHIVSMIMPNSVELIEHFIADENNPARLALYHQLFRLLHRETTRIKTELAKLLKEPLRSCAGLYDILTTKPCKNLLPVCDTVLSEHFLRRFQEETIDAQFRGNNFVLDGKEVSVEEVCRRHYCVKDGFSHALHCEGSVYLSLFHVLFGGMTKSGSIPPVKLSLCPDFFQEMLARRTPVIEMEIQRMEASDDFAAWVGEKFDKCPLETLQEPDVLKSIALSFEPQRLAQICETIVSNFVDFRKGFPDLLFWNPGTDKVKMVEVKGPRDSLSSNQILWLNRLLSIGFDALCCHVKVSVEPILNPV